MEKKGISQEALKLIACMTMLLDHLAVINVMGPIFGTHHGMRLEIYEILRLIGRLAFPIYCFLLTEGSFYTGSPLRYGLRLVICGLLSELPYDFALWGGFNWQHQNVMVTLFLGFIALEVMKRCSTLPLKLLAAVPFALLAEFAGGDYGAEGIMLVALFALTRGIPHQRLIQFLGMWLIFSPGHIMFLNWTGGIQITTQEWAVLALIPIAAYSGEKKTSNRLLQWGFYLFYPFHLCLLSFIGRL